MKPGLAVLPMEVWADAFEHPLINRQMLAQIADTNGDPNFTAKLLKFLHDPLCGKHSLHYLRIYSKRKKNSSKCQVQKKNVPAKYCASLAVARQGYRFGMGPIYKCEFPECEMPENIRGFKELAIRHIDDQALDFLDKIKPIFTDVLLNIGIGSKSEKNVRILLAHLLPMLASIRAIKCENYCLELLERQFPETLAMATELHLFCANPTFIPAYLNWLCTPLGFGVFGPRFLKTSANFETITAIVAAVRKQFLTAITSSTFVIFIGFDRHEQHNRINEFKDENATTNEELTVRNAYFKTIRLGIYEPNCYVQIMRNPMGAKAKMQEWIEKRAYYKKQLNNYQYYLHETGQRQLISIAGPALTIGPITKSKKADGVDQKQDQSTDNDEHEAGPSTSAKK